MLMRHAREYLGTELRQLSGAVIVPLGKTVAAVLNLLFNDGSIPVLPCLFGFPHPSGANGHRRAEFTANKIVMWGALMTSLSRSPH
jgi:hypothetical protein